MPEGSSILAFLGSIKTAKETLTLILDAPKVLEKAELEFRIASLTKTLTELENQANDFAKIIQDKDNKITELEDKLKFKENLIRQDGKFYEVDENGNSIGEPYCSRCWQSDIKAINLIQIEEDYFRCPDCKNFFGKRKPIYSSDGYF